MAGFWLPGYTRLSFLIVFNVSLIMFVGWFCMILGFRCGRVIQSIRGWYSGLGKFGAFAPISRTQVASFNCIEFEDTRVVKSCP